MTPNQMYIDARWTTPPNGATIDVLDPATEQVVGTAPAATADDIETALAAAERGWLEWREVDAWTRSAVLRRVGTKMLEHAEEIAETLTEEQGKPLEEARGEVRAAAEQFDWYADEGRAGSTAGRSIATPAPARLSVIKQPVGPVAAFTLELPDRAAVAEDRTGARRRVLDHPEAPEETPRTAFWIAQCCDEAGVPAGVVNIITGDPGAISSQLIASDVIRKVTLTGSVESGSTCSALRRRVKAVTMELGGHAPVLVFEDADVEKAVELSVAAKLRTPDRYVSPPAGSSFTSRSSTSTARAWSSGSESCG